MREPVSREPPPLDAHVELAAGSYAAVGEPGEERRVQLRITMRARVTSHSVI